MDLLQLRYFRAVAAHEHVGRAADDLGVAQPSVSRAVIRLEAELGGPLFDRVGRRVRLNTRGERFRTVVGRAVDLLDDGVREVRDGLSLELGEVSLAAETLLPVTGLASRFHARHPDAGLFLRQASAPGMAELLEEGRVDLCVASQVVEGRGTARRLLDEDRVLLALPDGHPLAARRTVATEELAGTGFVVPPVGYWQRALLDRLGVNGGFEPVVACETAEPAVTLEMVRAGLGVTLLPEVARRSTDPTGVAWRELADPTARRRLELVWREDRYLSPSARALAELAVAHWAG